MKDSSIKYHRNGITVAQLIEQLKSIPPDSYVCLAHDDDGNGYQLAVQVTQGIYYKCELYNDQQEMKRIEPNNATGLNVVCLHPGATTHDGLPP